MKAFAASVATALLLSVAPAVAQKARPSNAAIAGAPIAPVRSEFRREQAMSYGMLMARWNPFIEKAAKRFDIPARWIREVMRIESGGRTMMAENKRIVSSQGALGLMQIQPGTYAEMRTQYRLGPDPFDPHDNIFAGAAYLRWLRGKYGYPVMFEAYDDGPGHLEQRIVSGQMLPAETRNYIVAIKTALGDKSVARISVAPDARPVTFVGAIWSFTRPDGSKVVLDCTQVTGVRAPLLDEYAPGVQSVLTVGASSQGVTESEEVVRQVVRSHGGRV